ncbi:flagellar hook-associated protein FlgL [Thiorhodospira sibirica]|uniref:flagellar hook-associated protein FlgL n=1 Tax=Thiorhodospira sibirica TaxID=154347 RepID=UPI00022C4036|nr:flagellar hook-associated protein FlgL [Thiorhodospira sibirica]
MRISSFQIYNTGIEAIQRQQAEQSRTQLQLGSGRRILTPSDDPSGAVQTLEFESRIASTEQYQRNGSMAEQRLRLAESTLSSVGDALHRVREIVITGMNATQTNETRGYLAEEVRQIAKHVVQLANTREANGEYIFAGYNTLQLPFAANNVPDSEQPIRYLGSNEQREVQISPTRRVAIGDSGQTVFMSIRDGNRTFAIDAGIPDLANPGSLLPNTGSGIVGVGSVVDPVQWNANADTYTVTFSVDANGARTYEVTRDPAGAILGPDGNPLTFPADYVEDGTIEFNGIQFSVSGQPADGDSFVVRPSANLDMFQIFEDIAKALEAPRTDEVSQARQMNALNHGLQRLDNAQENTLRIRATQGTRLQAVDEQRLIHDNLLLNLKTTLSEIRDLDYAEAISRFQLQMTGLQAAQQSYTQVQRLSLFNYL